MDLIGTTVGHIRIIGLIGRGGMGEVYEGIDEKLDRQVALKAIRKSYRLDSQNRARFLREARILSQLDHPHICRIFDYIEGTEADLLVLEFIKGINLRAALKDGFDESMKMKIATQIAKALAAAHAKGVVHRDLKPGNVMLSTEGEVKVLDFGLAREVDEAKSPTEFHPSDIDLEGDPEETPFDQQPTDLKTQRGMVVGTAAFMSPEQARGEGSTTASDMYSYGLLLQELFTGKPPYSPELSGMELLYHVSRGETIPVTGIDPDLAKLIGRLKSPNIANRPSAVDTIERLYWIQSKPKRRLKRRLQAAFTLALAIVAAVMAILVVRVSHEVKRANRETETANQISDFLVEMFELSDPYFGRGETITARELLDRGLGKIKHELKDQPIQRARLMDTIGSVYFELGLFELAEPILREALQIRESNLGHEHLEVAESLINLAELHFDQGRYESAEKLFLRALDIQEKLLGDDHRDISGTLLHLANLYAQQRRNDASEALYQRSLSILQHTHGDEIDIARTKGGLGALYGDQGRYGEAEPLLRMAMNAFRDKYEPDDPRVVSVVYNLAVVYQQLGRFAEAEPMFESAAELIAQSFGSDHPNTATVLNSYGALCVAMKQYGKAEKLYGRALQSFEARLGPDHSHVAMVLNNLAEVCRSTGSYDEAITHARRSLAIKEKALGADHPRVAQSLRELALSYFALDDLGQAEAFLARSIGIWEQAGETTNPEYAKSLASMGKVLARKEQPTQAEARFKRALTIMRESLEPDHPEVISVTKDYAALLRKMGREKEARQIESETDL